jgi:tetratricopeptide (TPR) repeat protein
LWLYTARFYAATARHFGSATRGLAEEAYARALALAPNDARVYVAWGRAHLEHGDPKVAAYFLRQAVILDATDGQAYIYLGAAEQALGRFETARADYQEAARLLPESSLAHLGLASCYWWLNRPEEALAAVEQALERDPNNAQAIALLKEIDDSS